MHFCCLLFDTIYFIYFFGRESNYLFFRSLLYSLLGQQSTFSMQIHHTIGSVYKIQNLYFIICGSRPKLRYKFIHDVLSNEFFQNEHYDIKFIFFWYQFLRESQMAKSLFLTIALNSNYSIPMSKIFFYTNLYDIFCSINLFRIYLTKYLCYIDLLTIYIVSYY